MALELKGKGKAPATDSDEVSSSSSSSIAFHNALYRLETLSSGDLSPVLQTFLVKHLPQLQSPHDPFPRDAASKKAFGLLETPSEAERKLVEDISERFELDEVEAWRVLNAVRAEAGLAKGPKAKAKEDKLSEDDWDVITAHVFELRSAVIATVALLLRCHDDPSHALQPLAVKLLPDIITPTFPSTLLTSFTQRVSRPLPSQIRGSATHSKFWAKQLLVEQKALLELLFLVFYTHLPPDGPVLGDVLKAVRDTQWGQRQEMFGYFDWECKALVKEIGDLLGIIAVEGLSLEYVIREDGSLIPSPTEAPLPPTSLYHPTQLTTLNTLIVTLVEADSVRSSPLLLGWAFILSRITNSFTSSISPVPPAYTALSALLLHNNNPGSTTPLFQLYATHVLAPSSSLFPSLLSLLTSSLLTSSSASATLSPLTLSTDPNSIGYISVLSSLLFALPLFLRLSFLPDAQFAQYISCLSTLYSNPSSSQLCYQFWHALTVKSLTHDEDGYLLDVDEASDGADSLKPAIELALHRFPVQFGGFVKLVQGLCVGSLGLGEQSPFAVECAESCFVFLQQLPSLTWMLPGNWSPILTLPYEIVISSEGEASYRSVRPIPISRRLTIPVGTIGKLITPQGVKPVVVQWEVTYSAWRLFVDVLENYVGIKPRSAGGDVFGGGAGEKEDVGLPFTWDTEEKKEEDVQSVLEIFRTIFVQHHKLATTLLEKTDGVNGGPHFVEVVCKILDNVLSTSSTTTQSQQRKILPTKLITTLLALISAILPCYPGVIFDYLRSSSLLFPSSTSPSSASALWSPDPPKPSLHTLEAPSRTYPITLSLLSLVHSLILETQCASLSPIVTKAFAELKWSVLERALSWIKSDVWMSVGGWRFASLGEKWMLIGQLVKIWNLVLEEAELEDPSTINAKKNLVPHFVTSMLLDEASVAVLIPILATMAKGPQGIILLRKGNRFADAQVEEELVESTFVLVRKLIRIRMRREGPGSASLLEKLILSSTPPEGFLATSVSSLSLGSSLSQQSRGDILFSIAKFITASISAGAATQAAKTITLLALGSGEWAPRAPSFVQLLGGVEKVARWVEECLSILEEPTADEGLQIALWDMISAIIETQPSLAILFVTGRHYPFDDDPIVPPSTDTDSGALILNTSTAPPPPATRRLDRTAIGVGLEIVGTWEDFRLAQPALLAAVLRFFDFAWQHLVDYGTALNANRKKPELWRQFIEIVLKCSEPYEKEPEGEEDVQTYCHFAAAQSHAVRIIALDVQASLNSSPPAQENSMSVQELVKAVADGQRFTRALKEAMWTSCSPSLHEEIFKYIVDHFPTVPIEAFRLPPPSHALDDSRSFGSGYLYSLSMFRRKLDGLRQSQPNSMTSTEDFDKARDDIGRLNVNFSLVEAQIARTRAWLQLLEIAVPVVRKDLVASVAVARNAPELATYVADEAVGGQSMTIRHKERLSILFTLAEVTRNVPPKSVENYLVDIVAAVGKIFGSETFSPVESVAGRLTPSFHTPLFRLAFSVIRKLNACKEVGSGAAKADQARELRSAFETITEVMILATRDLLLQARAKNDVGIEQDVGLAVAVLTQLFRSPFIPSSTVWLAQCRKADLFRSALDVFVFMEQLDGRVLYAQPVLDLFLVMASSSPAVAEFLAVEGLVTALTNNALTAAAESGAITATGIDGKRTQEHALWTTMLSLIVSLTSSLGESTQFVEQEVTGFVRLYSAQLVTALSWNSETVLTLPALEEVLNTAALVYGLFHHPGVNSSVSASLADHALYLLQHVVFAILHPNILANLIEPTTPEERARLEADLSTMEEELTMRPMLGSVTLALLQLARVLIDSLVAYTQAFTTLTKETTEWRTDRAVVLPSSTVSTTEKASLGTLLDLATFCVDKVRTPLPATPPPKTVLPGLNSSTLTPYSADLYVQHAQQTLETALLLAVSQMGLWLAKPEPNPTRASLAIRREIQTEMVGDLLGVIDRTGHVGKQEKKKTVRFQDQGEGGSTGNALLRVLHDFAERLKE